MTSVANKGIFQFKKAHLLGFFLLGIFLSCEKPTPYKEISGNAQGTTYFLQFGPSEIKVSKDEIDKLLNDFDKSLSTYRSDSRISIYNNSDSGAWADADFFEMIKQSLQVYFASDSVFNPALKPLIAFWGFDTEKFQAPELVSQEIIDSLKAFCDFSKISANTINGEHLSSSQIANHQLIGDSIFINKPFKQFSLNFNAIAQGYAVDKIAMLLEEQRIENYIIELGGEMIVKGENQNREPWKIGIDMPLDMNVERTLKAIIRSNGSAIATSGSYRKFYEKNGKRYSHTINPSNGWPVEHSLLSATVLTNSCALADAYATVCMVLGTENSKELIEEKLQLPFYLIYTDISDSMKTYIGKHLKLEEIEEL